MRCDVGWFGDEIGPWMAVERREIEAARRATR